MTLHWTRGRQPDGVLHLSTDRKVSHVSTMQRSMQRWIPLIPNSFGLPAGTSCPGRTHFCERCYGANAEKTPSVHRLLVHNYDLLSAAGSVDAMYALLEEMLFRCVHELGRRDVALDELCFRIHWDGDFFSLEYAQAWRLVMGRFPGVQFWAYTRSFRPPVDVVPVLAGTENLALYLSVDAGNLDAAVAVTGDHPWLHWAACANDYATARALARHRPSPAPVLVCPENSGKLPLTSDAGRGACVDCRACIDGRRDVLFATSRKEIEVRRRG